MLFTTSTDLKLQNLFADSTPHASTGNTRLLEALVFYQDLYLPGLAGSCMSVVLVVSLHAS